MWETQRRALDHHGIMRKPVKGRSVSNFSNGSATPYTLQTSTKPLQHSRRHDVTVPLEDPLRGGDLLGAPLRIAPLPETKPEGLEGVQQKAGLELHEASLGVA